MPELPTMAPVLPPYIQSVLDRLKDGELDDKLRADATSVIYAYGCTLAMGMTVCLNRNTSQRGGVTVQLGPSQAVVAHTLVQSYPELVSVEELYKALWGGTSTKSINTIRVMMTELRKKLRPLMVDIANVHGLGYKLTLNSNP